MLILSRTKISRLLSIIRLTMLCYSTPKAVEIGLQYNFARDVRDVRSMRHEQLWPSSLFPELEVTRGCGTSGSGNSLKHAYVNSQNFHQSKITLQHVVEDKGEAWFTMHSSSSTVRLYRFYK